MSADNGIYILETISPYDLSKKEYRIAHLSAIDNVCWDDKNKKQSNNPEIMISNARDMWKNSTVYQTKTEALVEASEMYENVLKTCHVCEYGISTIKIAAVF